MTKEQMIERLQALAEILRRDVDISGSKADLEQRLSEWEEEAEALQDNDQEPSESAEVVPNVVKSHVADGASGNTEHVRVCMLKTAHLDAWDETDTRRLAFAYAGQVVYVEDRLVAGLVANGLAKKV